MAGVLKIFCKAPVAGAVKTRLIPVLGAAGAAALHARLARHALAAGCAAGYARVELWCSPGPEAAFFAEQRASAGVMLRQQAGTNLGERMANALDADGTVQVIIGSDCPDYTPALLAEARRRLADRPVDAVVAPAADGGYALIGLKRPVAGLFTDIPWGRAGVWARTRERLREAGLRWHELPTVRDVDRPEDLDWLAGLAGFEDLGGAFAAAPPAAGGGFTGPAGA